MGKAHQPAVDTPSGISNPSTYDPAIDGLRGLAILMVMLFHSRMSIHLIEAHFSFSDRIMRQGLNGVTLFFVISAYTICKSSENRFAIDRFPRLSFYIRRAFRILPLWWIYVSVAVWYWGQPLGALLPNFLMYFGFVGRWNFTGNGWSLFVEETFYFFFPIFFTLLMRPALVLLLAVALIPLTRNFMENPMYEKIITSLGWVGQLPLMHYFSFCLGILAFHLLKIKAIRVFFETRRGWLWFLDFAALALFVYSFYGSDHGMEIAFAAFALIYASSMEGSLWRRFASNPLLKRFGVCCFSIYLFHLLILRLLTRNDLFSFLKTSGLPAEALAIPLFIALSALSLLFGTYVFRWIESPCVALGKKVVQRTTNYLLKNRPLESVSAKSA